MPSTAPGTKQTHLSTLSLHIELNEATRNQKLMVLLSREDLTDSAGRLHMRDGYLREDLGDGILQFPELARSATEFTLTYLHPGHYFLTVVADLNNDGYPSAGDIVSPSRELHVPKESDLPVTIDDLNVQNGAERDKRG